MNILVITGSAHKKGTSSCLADAFIKGAEESGHTVCRLTQHLKMCILVLAVVSVKRMSVSVYLKMICRS